MREFFGRPTHLNMLRNRQIIDMPWANEYEIDLVVNLLEEYLDEIGKDIFNIASFSAGTDKARVELMCLNPADLVAAKLRFSGAEFGKLLNREPF